MCISNCTRGLKPKSILAATSATMLLVAISSLQLSAQAKQQTMGSQVTITKSTSQTSKTIQTHVGMTLTTADITWSGHFSATGEPVISKITPDPSGMVMIEGNRQTRTTAGTQSHSFILLFDSRGQMVWQHNNLPGISQFRAVQNTDGRLAIAGFDAEGEPFAVRVEDLWWLERLNTNQSGTTALTNGENSEPDNFLDEPEDEPEYQPIPPQNP